MEALNLRYDNLESYAPFTGKNHEQINLPSELTKTPEDTVINYFSILREAENMAGRSCGTIGQARMPFPIAYHFCLENIKMN